jgi:FkbM family methyltransferase
MSHPAGRKYADAMRKVARFVRSATPIPVRRRIRRAGDYFGYGLDAPEFADGGFPSIDNALRTVRWLGLDPQFAVDAGAYHGDWTKLFKAVFPDSRVLMIEAQDAKRPLLDQFAAQYGGDVRVETALLGAADGRSVPFVEMETGSSVFEERSPFERRFVNKTMQRLDTILAAGGYPRVDFLKLDVQGYELQVLEGAPVALAQASAVLLESSLLPVNTGCPLIADVMQFMDRAGFRLFDFCSQIRRKDGVLWQTDLLFLRKESPACPAPIIDARNW